jgi:NRPS condensation-like uncharacterized protein
VLDCRYETGFWRDRWVRVADPASTAVHVVTDPGDLEAETVAWVRRNLVLTRERPFRLVAFRRPGGSRLLFSLAHLAVDGAGVAAVAHVFAAHLYGVARSAPADARRSVAHALDRLRWYHVPTLARDMVEALAQPLRVLGAAKRERHFPTTPGSASSFRHLTIAAADVDRLKARCRDDGGTVNDILIGALARVAAGRSSGGPVAVVYTMDLRRYAATPRLTAANTSSILTVVVPRGSIGDLPTTVKAVAKITGRQRRRLAGPAFVVLPSLLAAGTPHGILRRLVPGIHPLAVDAPLRRGLVFTNVGRIDDGLAAFGDDIEDLRIIGPNIEGVTVPAVVAFGFRGALHLELFAPPGLADEALGELERELRAALEL